MIVKDILHNYKREVMIIFGHWFKQTAMLYILHFVDVSTQVWTKTTFNILDSVKFIWQNTVTCVTCL